MKNRIKVYRALRNLTQEVLADQLGVPHSGGIGQKVDVGTGRKVFLQEFGHRRAQEVPGTPQGVGSELEPDGSLAVPGAGKQKGHPAE